MVDPVKEVMQDYFKELSDGGEQQQKVLKETLRLVEKKIDGIEEDHFILKKMTEETYRKFSIKFKAEKHAIEKQISHKDLNSSNLVIAFKKAIDYSLKLNTLWR